MAGNLKSLLREARKLRRDVESIVPDPRYGPLALLMFLARDAYGSIDHPAYRRLDLGPYEPDTRREFAIDRWLKKASKWGYEETWLRWIDDCSVEPILSAMASRCTRPPKWLGPWPPSHMVYLPEEDIRTPGAPPRDREPWSPLPRIEIPPVSDRPKLPRDGELSSWDELLWHAGQVPGTYMGHHDGEVKAIRSRDDGLVETREFGDWAWKPAGRVERVSTRVDIWSNTDESTAVDPGPRLGAGAGHDGGPGIACERATGPDGESDDPGAGGPEGRARASQAAHLGRLAAMPRVVGPNQHVPPSTIELNERSPQ